MPRTNTVTGLPSGSNSEARAYILCVRKARNRDGHRMIIKRSLTNDLSRKDDMSNA